MAFGSSAASGQCRPGHNKCQHWQAPALAWMAHRGAGAFASEGQEARFCFRVGICSLVCWTSSLGAADEFSLPANMQVLLLNPIPTTLTYSSHPSGITAVHSKVSLPHPYIFPPQSSPSKQVISSHFRGSSCSPGVQAFLKLLHFYAAEVFPLHIRLFFITAGAGSRGTVRHAFRPAG